LDVISGLSTPDEDCDSELSTELSFSLGSSHSSLSIASGPLTCLSYSNSNGEKPDDKKSRSRKLEVGQKILVLLPTHTSKLLASWKGPYTIIDKVSPVDYKIKINGKTEKIFHVNMSKLWYERTDDIENSRNEVFACLDVISGLSTPDEDCDSDLNVSLTPNIESKESINDVTICNELIVEQKQQLHDLPG
jgi:hypothetical protein